MQRCKTRQFSSKSKATNNMSSQKHRRSRAQNRCMMVSGLRTRAISLKKLVRVQSRTRQLHKVNSDRRGRKKLTLKEILSLSQESHYQRRSTYLSIISTLDTRSQKGSRQTRRSLSEEIHLRLLLRNHTLSKSLPLANRVIMKLTATLLNRHLSQTGA